MAKPRIFISSTYYDLKYIRGALNNFISSMGYEPILSEKGDIAYQPDKPLDESCYREVENSDMLVLIIGGRYGSESTKNKTNQSKTFNSKYDSITKEELKTAIKEDIPVYIMIERPVFSEYETYLENKDNKTIKYAHVDSVNIFLLIEQILALPRNNPIFQFEKFDDIESWLKEQWAGLFRELLHRIKTQKALSSLGSQVNDLNEISTTLKSYLEQIVTKIIPEQSDKLIEFESNRLVNARISVRIKDTGIYRYLIENGFENNSEDVINALIKSRDIDELIKTLKVLQKQKEPLENLTTKYSREANSDFQKIKNILVEES